MNYRGQEAAPTGGQREVRHDLALCVGSNVDYYCRTVKRHTAKVSAVGGAGTTMGIANFHNAYLNMIIPIDANGAKEHMLVDDLVEGIAQGDPARSIVGYDEAIGGAGRRIELGNGTHDFSRRVDGDIG